MTVWSLGRCRLVPLGSGLRPGSSERGSSASAHYTACSLHKVPQTRLFSFLFQTKFTVCKRTNGACWHSTLEGLFLQISPLRKHPSVCLSVSLYSPFLYSLSFSPTSKFEEFSPLPPLLLLVSLFLLPLLLLTPSLLFLIPPLLLLLLTTLTNSSPPLILFYLPPTSPLPLPPSPTHKHKHTVFFLLFLLKFDLSGLIFRDTLSARIALIRHPAVLRGGSGGRDVLLSDRIPALEIPPIALWGLTRRAPIRHLSRWHHYITGVSGQNK